MQVTRRRRSKRDAAAADRFFAPDYANDVPGRAPGREGLKTALREFFAAFPDAQESVDMNVAEGDLVVCRKLIRATHEGPFLGVPATGCKVVIVLQEISRFEAGHIARSWIALMRRGSLPE